MRQPLQKQYHAISVNLHGSAAKCLAFQNSGICFEVRKIITTAPRLRIDYFPQECRECALTVFLASRITGIWFNGISKRFSEADVKSPVETKAPCRNS
jgi:hypothetical protein